MLQQLGRNRGNGERNRRISEEKTRKNQQWGKSQYSISKINHPKPNDNYNNIDIYKLNPKA